jgi:dimethylaniline monooxygenase (N-oxide forming)
MFDEAFKTEIGLPVKGKASFDKEPTADEWKSVDQIAERVVDEKLPFLSKGPVLKNPQSNEKPQRYWRLYRRAIPLALADRGDRSLAILGQIHTVQTPLVSEMQSFWAILYLIGEIDLPDHDTMVKEIAEWNAWTRKRYLSQGHKFPYSLYDFLSVSEAHHVFIIAHQELTTNPSSMSTRFARTWASTHGASQILWLNCSRLTGRKTSTDLLTSTLQTR